jgi:hypothetical protein
MIGTPDAKHVCVAHADERLQVKLRDEATADETDTESSVAHRVA